MLTQQEQFLKRVFDLTVSLLLFPFLLIPMLFLVAMATMSTRKFGLFIQLRVGKEGDTFSFYKIRSLRGKKHTDIHEIALHQTVFGKWLRNSKLDELPQLFNVINGTMSLVGPRPDVPGYADQLKGEDRIVLSVRPGITGPATLKYKNEDELLIQQKDALHYNDTIIWPDKVAINKEYVRQWSFNKDLDYLWKSVFD